MTTPETRPPVLALRLLRWFCKPYYAEVIEGDLFELFERQRLLNKTSARRAFAWNVIRFMRWRYIKNLEDFYPKTPVSMFKNHFKISVRNLLKYKVYTLINLSGLAVGMACALLILIHVKSELNYDRHIPGSEQVYYIANGNEGKYTPAQMAATMVREYPEVIAGTRIAEIGTFVGKINHEMISIDGGVMTDSTFFDVFPQHFLMGTPVEALNSPNSLVLTESLAERYFPGQNPMGLTLRFEDEDFIVTAVISDPLKTTSIPFTFLIDLPRLWEVTTGNWTGNNFYSYLKLHPETDPGVVNSKFLDFVKRHFGSDLAEFGESVEDYIEERLSGGHSSIFTLIPIQDIHLHYPNLSLGAGGKFSNVLILILIASLILIIASVNYINMATARASIRLKEVGMRKVMGSTRGQLINQFFMESVVLALLALIIGCVLAVTFLPFFNELIQRDYTFNDLFSPQSILILLGLMFIISILSGSYPAIYISRFQPVQALRGDVRGSSNLSMRRILVIFQFAVSIFLIATTLVIYQQVILMQNTDPGINTKQTFLIRNSGTMGDGRAAFIGELNKHPGIQSVSATSLMPATPYISNWTYKTVEDNPRAFSPDHLFADENLVEVLGIEITQGRYFLPGSEADSANVVISESFAKEIGGEVINSRLTRGPEDNYRIIGVFKDFHATTVKRKIEPMIIRKTTDDFFGDYLLVRMEGNLTEQAGFIQKTWERMKQDYPFDGVFVSESFARLYDREMRFGRIFITSAILAIFIASLGLLSLTAFVLQKRFKEIAVRKVLGASVIGITNLINAEFTKLVLVGAAIALPIVYYYGELWLSEFPIRIRIQWMYLLLPVLIVVLISILMISIQAVRVTMNNPVEALKQE